MSVARISISQPEPGGKWARKDIATEYGSSPVEHAALQTRTRRDICPCSARASHSGKTRLSRNSNCRGSRKKCVSFVEIASTSRTRSASSDSTSA